MTSPSTSGRFKAEPKRGVLNQLGRWRIEVVEGNAGARLDTRTLRAGAAIAALLNGQRVETADEDTPARFEVLPQAEHWLVVRLARRGTATEIARVDDESLALRVASLLSREAPALDAPSRRSILRLGTRRPHHN